MKPARLRLDGIIRSSARIDDLNPDPPPEIREPEPFPDEPPPV